MTAARLSSALRGGALSRARRAPRLRLARREFAGHVPRADPRHVDARRAPAGFDAASAVVYPGFVTEEEGRALAKEAGRRLRRRRFEAGHWDGACARALFAAYCFAAP